ncbi:unnamed protein product [Somion occarium]|uniref:Secreted protein n=1 Tax=Somion occarium TaxID=3059160 RepID=A0ABP1DFB8_9APHY
MPAVFFGWSLALSNSRRFRLLNCLGSHCILVQCCPRHRFFRSRSLPNDADILDTCHEPQTRSLYVMPGLSLEGQAISDTLYVAVWSRLPWVRQGGDAADRLYKG